MLVLEDLEFARARGARVYAELLGYGLTNDAYNMIAPLPGGGQSARAMQLALTEAGLRARPDQLSERSRQLDPGRRRRPRSTLFARCSPRTRAPSRSAAPRRCTATRSVPAAPRELAITVLALQAGHLPPTVNLEHPDETCDLDLIVGTASPASRLSTLWRTPLASAESTQRW